MSNHLFETLYVIVSPAEEVSSKKAPVYALTQGQKINIPKTLLDFDDNILMLGIKKTDSMVYPGGHTPSALSAVTTYLKIGTL